MSAFIAFRASGRLRRSQPTPFSTVKRRLSVSAIVVTPSG